MLTSRKVTILHGDIEISNGKLFMSKLAQKILGIFFIFLVLFNFPILNIFWKGDLVLGVPLVYLYIFSIWLLMTIALIWLMEFRNKK